MAETVQLATLRRALELAGGLAALAGAIGISGYEIYRALDTEEVSDALFLRAADFINRSEMDAAMMAADVDRHPGNNTRQ